MTAMPSEPVEIYCVKCKAKTASRDIEAVTMKNGRPRRSRHLRGVRHQEVPHRHIALTRSLIRRLRGPRAGRHHRARPRPSSAGWRCYCWSNAVCPPVNPPKRCQTEALGRNRSCPSGRYRWRW